MAEINWDRIGTHATDEIGPSPNPVNVDEANLALGGVVLVDRRPNRSRLRSFVEELPYVALGYNARESAALQNLNPEAVSMRRRRAKEEYRVATTPQLVVATIQNQHLRFDEEPEPKPTRLTSKQQGVLHMSALGYRLEEIAEYLQVQPDRVQTHYEMIRLKLGARNMNHAMLRAFSLGIFKLGQPIPKPEELEAKSRLTISVANKEFGTNETDIVEPAELELLQTMGSLGLSIFDRRQLLEAGFLSDIESKTARDNKYMRTMGDLRRKLNIGAGFTVLDRARIEEQRVYIVREEITIRSSDQSYLLPSCTEEDMASARRARSRNVQRIRLGKTATADRPKLAEKSAGIPKPEAEPSERIENSPPTEMDRTELIELGPQLFQNLKARSRNEVKINRHLSNAVGSIMNRGLLNDYRTRVVIALRYGQLGSAYSAQILNRVDQRLRMNEVMAFVPGYQGLDVPSVSQLTAMKPHEVLRVEKKFLEDFQLSFPVLSGMAKTISDQYEKSLHAAVRKIKASAS